MAKVSVVIPVYNVEPYLDQCLESVTKQTFGDIEIIIINDGSTDGSGDKCLEWAKQDDRIIYVSKKNDGLGPTRNLGISMASSEYVAFVDSDDWCDRQFIELLYIEAIAKTADIVICGHYSCHAESGEIISTYYPDCAGSIGRFLASHSSLCLKLYRKSLFINNDIKMPKCVGEDVAINGFIMVKAKNVCMLPKLLYYYRVSRKNSVTSDNYSKCIEVVDCFLSYHCELFKRDDMFEHYKSYLLVYTMRNIKYLKNILMHNGRDYHAWYEDRKKLLDHYFLGWDVIANTIVLCLGSYNLGSALRIFSPILTENISEFCFSGIISLLSPTFNRSIPSNDNPFLAQAIANDFQKYFVSGIKKKPRPDYVIIDFLEERFDLLSFGGGEYYTHSEALADSRIYSEADIVKRWDPTTEALWKEKCRELIKLLQFHFEPKQIILVKNHLAEYYGVTGKSFVYENIDDIRFINKKLDDCYSFFERHFPGIQVVETTNLETYYTFTHFRHGRYPWHYNNEYYINLADEVTNRMKSFV